MFTTRSVTGRGGGGEHSNIKKARVCSSDTVKRTPKRHQDPVLWVRLEIKNFETKLKIS